MIYYNDKSPNTDRGFTNFELGVLIAFISVFIITGIIFYRITSKSAYDITAKHDLVAFEDFQKFYFKLNGKCIGNTGQIIRKDPNETDIIFDGYKISEGVIITIVSGDPENPYDKNNPYIFQCRHLKSDKVFEMNFATGKLVER